MRMINCRLYQLDEENAERQVNRYYVSRRFVASLGVIGLIVWGITLALVFFMG